MATTTTTTTTTATVARPIYTAELEAAAKAHGVGALSAEQQAVFEQTMRRSCAVLGAGGSGKSHMIRFLAWYARHTGLKMAVTSMTGAATIVLAVPDATTLHRWAGVGLAKDPLPATLEQLRRRFGAVKAWRDTQVLVIDEVSMLSQAFFELLDGVGRALRGRPLEPFGGLRVVAFGDFFQLPPVGDRGAPPGDATGRFCFESPVWRQMFPMATAHFQLSRLHRQDGDLEFQRVLTEIRSGACSDASAAYMLARTGRADLPAVPPIKVLPRNEQVDHENDLAYSKVAGAERVFRYAARTDAPHWMNDGRAFSGADALRASAASGGKPAERERERAFLAASVPPPDMLRLKVGAAVVLQVNLDVSAGLCNGSQGAVTAFVLDVEGAGAPQFLPRVKFLNGAELVIKRHWWQSAKMPSVAISQLPLRHGWACSVHKAQGATFDAAILDAGASVFAPGQTYVAVSRVRSGAGLFLLSFDRNKVAAHPAVTAFHAELDAAAAAANNDAANDAGHILTPPAVYNNDNNRNRKRARASSSFCAFDCD